MNISGRILTPDGWVQGQLHHAADISHIEADTAAPADQ
jgi:hypothetical protein